LKQEVSLNKQEVNTAILEYAEKHGVRLDGMDATVEVMATRGDRELFATIALEPKNIKDGSKQEKVVEEVKSIQEDIDEGVPVEVEPIDADIDDEDSIFG